MYMRKNEIIPKKILDAYESVYFANEEHTIYVVSKRFKEELRYNYARVSNGTLLLKEWCLSAGNFINNTAIVLTKEGNHEIITEDGKVVITRTYDIHLSHYYYGTYVARYESYGKGTMYELLNLNDSRTYFDRFDGIQNVDKEKLVGRHPSYFWVMKKSQYNFINSKGMLLLDEYCDGFEECDNKAFLHVWYDVSKKYQKHKYVRISDGKVITEGDFKKVTKIKHGLWKVENTFGYCNVLGYNQEFIFSAWYKSINVMILDEKNRVCFLVSDEKEDKTVRYIYSPFGKKLAEVDEVIGIINKYSRCLINVKYNRNTFYIDHLTGEIVNYK